MALTWANCLRSMILKVAPSSLHRIKLACSSDDMMSKVFRKKGVASCSTILWTAWCDGDAFAMDAGMARGRAVHPSRPCAKDSIRASTTLYPVFDTISFASIPMSADSSNTNLFGTFSASLPKVRIASKHTCLVQNLPV